MQAANVRGVGELFSSQAQVTRIAQLERDVHELREVVSKLAVKDVTDRYPGNCVWSRVHCGEDDCSPSSVRVRMGGQETVPARVSNR